MSAAIRLASAIYGDGVYGHSLLGDDTSVAELDRRQIVEFAQRHVGPGGATLVAVGDFEAGPFAALCDRLLASWPATEAAVRGFQRAQGLDVDGIAGPQTLQRLRETSAAGAGRPVDAVDTGTQPAHQGEARAPMTPHTPPTPTERRANATLAALAEVRARPLLVLFLLAVPLSCIHQFYFVHTSTFLADLQRRVASADTMASSINAVLGVGGGGLMTIGQMVEIGVLFLIPLFGKLVTRKSLLAVGIVAYALRMALFAYTDSMLPILLGVGLTTMLMAGSLVAGVAGLLLFLLGFEYGFVTSLSLVSEATPNARGRTLALGNGIGTVARGSATIASGWLYGAHGIVGSAALSGSVALCSLTLFLASRRGSAV